MGISHQKRLLFGNKILFSQI